tara:strand:- start:13 stop:615 length:603 start_codon:yes stop_codon:yes gene_type:complete
MLDLINALFLQYGLFALFGLMFINMIIFSPPSELIMVTAGFLIYTSNFSFFSIIIIATIANLLGTHVWYFIGQATGYKWILKINYFKKRLTEDSLERIAKRISKDGSYWVLIFRLIPFFRAVVSVPAGMIKIKYKTFIINSLIGMLIWNIFWASIGYFLGRGFFEYDLYVTILTLISILIVLFLFYKQCIKYLKSEKIIK